MYFLFSGEGATDLGVCAQGNQECKGADYLYGPMTIMVDQIVHERQCYSFIEMGYFGFVTRQKLESQAKTLKWAKKSGGLPGKKRAKETRFFFANARALAHIAVQEQQQLKDEVVAILFRDADRALSSNRGTWETKWQSMLDGFEEEAFNHGVPMLPNPTSEAWFLCALREPPYQNCESIEGRSGRAPTSDALKRELEEFVGSSDQDSLPVKLCHLVRDRRVDVDRIQMPSFKEFKDRLRDVIWRR